MRTLLVTLLLAVYSLTSFAVTAANNSNKTPDFAYNTETNGNQVVSKTVYRVESQKFLHKHLKYNYTYNNEGHLSKKEVLKWNREKENFEKQYCLNFNYNGNEVDIEMVSWNAKMKAYSTVKEKTVYQVSGENKVINYCNYKWSERNNNWKLIMSHTTSADIENLLAEM